MMKKVILNTFVLILLVTVSCNKDQRTVRKLDGIWESKSISIDGKDVSNDVSIKLTFEKCKQKKEGECPGKYVETHKTAGTTVSGSLEYKVSGKGSTLTTEETVNGTITTTIMDITLKKKNLTLEWTDSGRKIKAELEKK